MCININLKRKGILKKQGHILTRLRLASFSLTPCLAVAIQSCME